MGTCQSACGNACGNLATKFVFSERATGSSKMFLLQGRENLSLQISSMHGETAPKEEAGCHFFLQITFEVWHVLNRETMKNMFGMGLSNEMTTWSIIWTVLKIESRPICPESWYLHDVECMWEAIVALLDHYRLGPILGEGRGVCVFVPNTCGCVWACVGVCVHLNKVSLCWENVCKNMLGNRLEKMCSILSFNVRSIWSRCSMHLGSTAGFSFAGFLFAGTCT